MKNTTATLLGVVFLGVQLAWALSDIVSSRPDGTAPDPDPYPSMKMFAAEPPVADADPTIRHEQTIRAPTRLIFPRSPRYTTVSYDTTWMQRVVLHVGYKMTLGVRSRLFYYDGAEAVELGRGLSSIGWLNGGGGRVLHGITEVVDRRGSLQIIEELVVFETDVPDQHLWQPERGRYHELWKGVATGVLERQR